MPEPMLEGMLVAATSILMGRAGAGRKSMLEVREAGSMREGMREGGRFRAAAFTRRMKSSR
jgi:hypothetical protein